MREVRSSLTMAPVSIGLGHRLQFLWHKFGSNLCRWRCLPCVGESAIDKRIFFDELSAIVGKSVSNQ